PAKTRSPTRKLSLTTSGVVSTKSMKLRPFVGRFWMARSLTVELTSDLVVSTKGASPETVTEAEAAGSRTNFKVASAPTDTVTLTIFLGAKPARSAATA